jgi:hypothetical protein
MVPVELLQLYKGPFVSLNPLENLNSMVSEEEKVEEYLVCLVNSIKLKLNVLQFNGF